MRKRKIKTKPQNVCKITDDGYILELHRIPPRAPRHNGLSPLNGPAGRIHDDYKATEGRGRPVFLQHGVFSSSACWLLNPSHRSLGLSNIYFKIIHDVHLVWNN